MHAPVKAALKQPHKLHDDRCASISDYYDICVRFSRDGCVLESKANLKECVHLDDVADAHVLNVPEDGTTCIRSRGIGMGYVG